MTQTPLSPILPYILMAVAVIDLGVAYFFYTLYQKQKLLQDKGIETQGRITEVKTISTKMGKGLVAKYNFQDGTGNDVVSSFVDLPADEPKNVGDAISITYLYEKSKINNITTGIEKKAKGMKLMFIIMPTQALVFFAIALALRNMH